MERALRTTNRDYPGSGQSRAGAGETARQNAGPSIADLPRSGAAGIDALRRRANSFQPTSNWRGYDVRRLITFLSHSSKSTMVLAVLAGIICGISASGLIVTINLRLGAIQ